MLTCADGFDHVQAVEPEVCPDLLLLRAAAGRGRGHPSSYRAGEAAGRDQTEVDEQWLVTGEGG